MFGYAEITWQYYDRYRIPVMHTETNFAQGEKGDEAVNWLWKEWANVLRRAKRWRSGSRLYVVFADGSDRLGRCFEGRTR